MHHECRLCLFLDDGFIGPTRLCPHMIFYTGHEYSVGG